MKIYESLEHNAAVLTLDGKLMGDPDTHDIHERIKNLMTMGITHVVVDLEPLEWLNSAGLGVLIASLTTLRKAGGDLVLANVGGKAKELICMTHLNQVFLEYDSVDMALDALGHEHEAVI